MQQRLRLPEPTATWVRTLRGKSNSQGTALPDIDVADGLLERLGVESTDRVATLRARPDPVADPALWWVLERVCEDLRATMGTPPAGGGWPALPPHTGSIGRHLLVWRASRSCPTFLRFQRRFQTFTDREQADWAPLEHLFHRRYEGNDVPAELLDELPRATTLQRAVVAHLRGGDHWYNQTGWIEV
ncbi:hypothetical protein GCM10009872_47690 [Actinopolymorpha rutila]